MNGPNFEIVCGSCRRKETSPPGAWFQHIQFLVRLQDAQYPFDKDDLSIEEWLDIGAMRKALEKIQRMPDKDL